MPIAPLLLSLAAALWAGQAPVAGPRALPEVLLNPTVRLEVLSLAQALPQTSRLAPAWERMMGGLDSGLSPESRSALVLVLGVLANEPQAVSSLAGAELPTPALARLAEAGLSLRAEAANNPALQQSLALVRRAARESLAEVPAAPSVQRPNVASLEQLRAWARRREAEDLVEEPAPQGEPSRRLRRHQRNLGELVLDAELGPERVWNYFREIDSELPPAEVARLAGAFIDRWDLLDGRALRPGAESAEDLRRMGRAAAGLGRLYREGRWGTKPHEIEVFRRFARWTPATPPPMHQGVWLSIARGAAQDNRARAVHTAYIGQLDVLSQVLAAQPSLAESVPGAIEPLLLGLDYVRAGLLAHHALSRSLLDDSDVKDGRNALVGTGGAILSALRMLALHEPSPLPARRLPVLTASVRAISGTAFDGLLGITARLMDVLSTRSRPSTALTLAAPSAPSRALVRVSEEAKPAFWSARRLKRMSLGAGVGATAAVILTGGVGFVFLLLALGGAAAGGIAGRARPAPALLNPGRQGEDADLAESYQDIDEFLERTSLEAQIALLGGSEDPDKE